MRLPKPAAAAAEPERKRSANASAKKPLSAPGKILEQIYVILSGSDTGPGRKPNAHAPALAVVQQMDETDKQEFLDNYAYSIMKLPDSEMQDYIDTFNAVGAAVGAAAGAAEEEMVEVSDEDED
jgi:uncharacterized Ntn-hydrolase superfamily protein